MLGGFRNRVVNPDPDDLFVERNVRQVEGFARVPGAGNFGRQDAVAAAGRYGPDQPVPRGHGEGIAVDGETEPVIVKWAGGSHTKSRRDNLTQEQWAAETGRRLGATGTADVTHA
ncbi:hypothetical protein [Streptomyces sp. NBC_00932]|uniref:hypothetical protein n=1 Tax=Streptomyces sp. NBC_00932 TaxID=2903690 RepID=UPI003864EDC8|nr:hypothetical protein OG221_01050 [Streptomyces sp. NBC_00932]